MKLLRLVRTSRINAIRQQLVEHSVILKVQKHLVATDSSDDSVHQRFYCCARLNEFYTKMMIQPLVVLPPEIMISSSSFLNTCRAARHYFHVVTAFPDTWASEFDRISSILIATVLFRSMPRELLQLAYAVHAIRQMTPFPDEKLDFTSITGDLFDLKLE